MNELINVYIIECIGIITNEIENNDNFDLSETGIKNFLINYVSKSKYISKRLHRLSLENDATLYNESIIRLQCPNFNNINLSVIIYKYLTDNKNNNKIFDNYINIYEDWLNKNKIPKMLSGIFKEN